MNPTFFNDCTSPRTTTEEMRALDIRRLQRAADLQPGVTVTVTWSHRGESSSCIKIRLTSRTQAMLEYQVRVRRGGWQAIQEPVAIGWTRCHFGGHRPWWHCPACDRRVAILYGGPRFLCRRCHNLVYACQNEDGGFRALRKAQKLRERLGASTDTRELIYDKPKGMHRSTFERLKREVLEAEEKMHDFIRQRWPGVDHL